MFGYQMAKSKHQTRLAIARVKSGLSQEELAKRTGISVTHLRRLESGDYTLTPEQAERLSNHLGGVSVFWLLSGKGPLFNPTTEDEPVYIKGNKQQRSEQWYKFLVLHLDRLRKDGNISDWLGVELVQRMAILGTIDATPTPDDIPIKDPKGWEPPEPPGKLIKSDRRQS